MAPKVDSSRASRLIDYQQGILKHLQETLCPASPLLRIWEVSYVDGGNLILPAEAAVEIARGHPRGYHHGVWHLATEYEVLTAKGLLVNSNPRAPGHQEPKSFSAWPRDHDVALYRRAKRLRRGLAHDVLQTSAPDRTAYLEEMHNWHQSTRYISKISGHTRLSEPQLQQLHTALLLEQVDAAATSAQGAAAATGAS